MVLLCFSVFQLLQSFGVSPYTVDYLGLMMLILKNCMLRLGIGGVLRGSSFTAVFVCTIS